MKRTNPNTNAPFKYGDKRADGFRFFNYRTQMGASGYRYELWLSPEAFDAAEKRDRFKKHKKRRQAGKPIRLTRGKIARSKVKVETSLHA
jgi:hypothetical protein